MHTRKVTIKNGITTIVAHHDIGGDRLKWNGFKWVLDVPYTYTVNEMMKAVLKTKKED